MFVCVGLEILNESVVGFFNLVIGLWVIIRCEIVFDFKYIIEVRNKRVYERFFFVRNKIFWVVKVCENILKEIVSNFSVFLCFYRKCFNLFGKRIYNE